MKIEQEKRFNVRKIGEYLPFFFYSQTLDDAKRFIEFQRICFCEDWELCRYDDSLRKWVKA